MSKIICKVKKIQNAAWDTFGHDMSTAIVVDNNGVEFVIESINQFNLVVSEEVEIEADYNCRVTSWSQPINHVQVDILVLNMRNMEIKTLDAFKHIYKIIKELDMRVNQDTIEHVLNEYRQCPKLKTRLDFMIKQLSMLDNKINGLGNMMINNTIENNAKLQAKRNELCDMYNELQEVYISLSSYEDTSIYYSDVMGQ